MPVVEESSPMAGLSIAGLSRRFGSTLALEDVSCDLPAGAFCLLLGANGAGKTTLLQALAGAIRADAGVARFEGAEIGSGIWQRRSNLAYAGHSAGAYPLASVEQNLRFARRLGGQPTLPPVGKAIAGFGLCDQADQRAGTLSRGQRQRLNWPSQLFVHRGCYC